MAAPLTLEKSETLIARVHYENVIYDTLWTIWRRKRLIGAVVADIAGDAGKRERS